LPIADLVRSSAFRRFSLISLAPGFSPVSANQTNENRFNGFPIRPKAPAHRRHETVKTVSEFFAGTDTRLKPGANEIELRAFICG
jgi:hypothetical protein